MSETKKKVSFWLKIVIAIATGFGIASYPVGTVIIEVGQKIIKTIDEAESSPTPEAFK